MSELPAPEAIDFDTAYSFFDDAVAAHSPSNSVVKHTYKRMKMTSPFDSEKDFLDSWLNKIRAEATEAFHFYYPLEEQFEEKREAPAATVGGIARAEYTKQRKYIEQFPLLTVEEVEKMGKEIDDEYLKNKDDDDVFNFEDMLNDKAER